MFLSVPVTAQFGGEVRLLLRDASGLMVVHALGWGGVGGVGEGRGVVGKLGLLTLIHMQPDSSAICPDSNPSTRVSIFNFRDDILMFCFIGLFQEGFVFLFFS